MKFVIFASLRALLVWGVSGVGAERVFVMEGDSVTLNTDVQTNQQDRVRWYYNDIRIAQINRDQSKICTDVQCKERFTDRLKLDHQTGSLTITNTTTEDSGEYQLKILSKNSEKIFDVTVTGVLVAEMGETKTVMDRAQFTSDTDPHNTTLVAVISTCVLLVGAAAVVIYYRRRKSVQKRNKCSISRGIGSEDHSLPVFMCN